MKNLAKRKEKDLSKEGKLGGAERFEWIGGRGVGIKRKTRREMRKK
jgi:hypothetical protein